jgi:hypothetical protein
MDLSLWRGRTDKERNGEEKRRKKKGEKKRKKATKSPLPTPLH